MTLCCYIGIGDFIAVQYDCDINNQILQIEFAITSVICIVSALFILGSISQRIIVAFKENKLLSASLQPQFLFQVLYFVSVGIGLATIAVAKAVNGAEYSIGKSAVTTTAYFIFAFFGWMGEIVYLRMVFKLLEGFDKFMDQDAYNRMRIYTTGLQKYLPYLIPAITMACILPMFLLMLNDDNFISLVYAINMFYAVLFAIYVYFIIYSITMVRIEMLKTINLSSTISVSNTQSRSKEDEAIRKIYLALGILKMAFVCCEVPFVIVFPILTFWDFWGKINAYI